MRERLSPDRIKRRRTLAALMYAAEATLPKGVQKKALWDGETVTEHQRENFLGERGDPTVSQLAAYVENLLANGADRNKALGIFEFGFPNQFHALKGMYVSAPISESERAEQIALLAKKLDKGWRVEKAGKYRLAGDRTLIDGWGCTNPEFNLKLLADRPKIILDDDLPLYDGWKNQMDLLAFAKTEKKGDATNDPKIGLASDFTGSSEVKIRKTDYYSSMVSDQISWIRIVSRAVKSDGLTPAFDVSDGTSAFIDRETGKLLGLNQARVSNQIGVSTLAFSNDGHLMIVYQDKANRESPDMLAPSGSGSLDWDDYEHCKKSGANYLVQLIEYGANRELFQECGLQSQPEARKRKIKSKVLLIGFARMLHRAAKPEFFLLGRIDAEAKEICDDRRKKEKYVEQIIPWALEAADWSQPPTVEIMRLSEFYLKKAIAGKSGATVPLSYPLAHGLNLLIEACKDSRAAVRIDKFLREDFQF